ncbi:MAG: hypothetical protein JWQ71_742 [Pedosphaera sp.]|nr:hypothetical protein [Pedosphaera sp.]
MIHVESLGLLAWFYSVMTKAAQISVTCSAGWKRVGISVFTIWAILFGLNTTIPARDLSSTNEAIPSAFGYQRKALALGRGLPQTEAGGGPTHPQSAKDNFLKLIGNPKNNSKKGWTCDLSYDLMLKLGMDPKTTSYEKLFEYIGRHHLGYRIVLLNMPAGQGAGFWGAAVDNGMMPFAPHFNNSKTRYEDPVGIKAAVSVGGGAGANYYSYGPSLEFYDALPKWMSAQNYEDAAESWANQVVATKFTRILDAHPNYNIWDAREHMRQAGSRYAEGWTEQEGFGRVNESVTVTNLLPGAPVEFWAMKSTDNRRVKFTWRNFLQSDFASTVIARKDGRIIYEGADTNFTWVSDVDGEEIFKYWSKNRAGVVSRWETNNMRTIQGLAHLTNQLCLILGAPTAKDSVNLQAHYRFQKSVPLWICDVVFRPGNTNYDGVTNFPSGPVVAVLPDYAAMVSYAIEKKYRMLIVPATVGEQEDLYSFKSEWDRAAAHGIAVVLPHCPTAFPLRVEFAHRESPPRLFSAMVVSGGREANERTYGPGLEFFDAFPAQGTAPVEATPNAGAAYLAVKLAKVMDANTNYNIWDARQHLRQSASYYTKGWTETNGYGRAAEKIEKLDLDIAPPLEIRGVKSSDGKTVALSWENFLQSDFAETVIAKGNGTIIYQGAGTNFIWKSDVTGEEEFHFASKSKAGRLSREESYTVVRVKGLVPF